MGFSTILQHPSRLEPSHHMNTMVDVILARDQPVQGNWSTIIKSLTALAVRPWPTGSNLWPTVTLIGRWPEERDEFKGMTTDWMEWMNVWEPWSLMRNWFILGPPGIWLRSITTLFPLLIVLSSVQSFLVVAPLKLLAERKPRSRCRKPQKSPRRG